MMAAERDDKGEAACRQAEEIAWAPIECAPKDGTVIDLWVVGTFDAVTFYCPVAVRRPDGQAGGRVADVRWRRDAWRPASACLLHPINNTTTPTHWRHRPAGPEDRPRRLLPDA